MRMVLTGILIVGSLLASSHQVFGREASVSAEQDSILQTLDERIVDLRREQRIRNRARNYFSETLLFDDQAPRGRRVLVGGPLQGQLEFASPGPEVDMETAAWSSHPRQDFRIGEIEEALGKWVRLRVRLTKTK
jgi:hypothetical protein